MSLPEHQPRYFPFEKPHVFTCVVNKIPLTAAIKGEYKMGEHFGFQVNFSDGLKPLFIAMEDFWWCEKNAEPYLEGIRKELNRFVAFQLTQFINSNLLNS